MKKRILAGITIGMMLFATNCHKEKSNEEKIVGLWVGYKCDSASAGNSDTLTFTGNTLRWNSKYGNYFYPKYELHGNTLIGYKNDTEQVSWTYRFIEDDSLHITPQFTAGLCPDFYLTKK